LNEGGWTVSIEPVSVTREVVEFVESTTNQRIPTAVAHLAKRHILDAVAVTLGGVSNQATRIAQKVYAQQGGSPEATAIGFHWRGPVTSVALVNGIAGHVLDYDDTQLATHKEAVYGLLTHPGVPVMASVLPLAEARGLSGKDVVRAFAVGNEVECRLADASFPRHYQQGFHASGTFGHFAATTGCASLIGLGGEKLAMALGLAGAQAAGLRENFGTMGKSFHVGKAASNGILAVLFAEKGYTAAPNILEATRGFYNASSGGFYIDKIVGKLGNPWFCLDPGVSIKPHPSGSLTHPGMTLMLRLITAHDVSPEQVVKVSVGTNKYMPNALKHPRPTNELEAKFSMQFCMAVLLLDRKGGLNEFTDEATRRPDVMAMIEKVDFYVHEELEALGYDQMWTQIDIELTDGQVISGRNRVGKGHPEDPMSDAELANKFRECAEGVITREQTERAIEVIMTLEEAADLANLVKAVTPS
jgi:2-methylcitrate dehydratase PrpD